MALCYGNSVAEPPSFMLLQAADLPVSQLPILTMSQFVPGLLALALSAAFKAVVRAMDHSDERDRGHYSSRWRISARLGQYLGLTAGAVILAAPAASVWHTFLLLGTAFLLYLLLVLVGRLVATVAPGGLLAFMRPVLSLFSLLAAPLVAVGDRFISWVEQQRPADPPEAFGERLEVWLESSGLSEDELALLRNALRFRERDAGDLMVPRPDVVWLSLRDEPSHLVDRVRSSGHSRFPLCDESPDQVVGYLHVRDLGLLSEMPSPEQLHALARPVSFVPETADSLSLLRRFQREQSHMAIVVDEFGGTAGIVTLEDLLEVLVGEIYDEFDADDGQDVTPLRNGEVLVDGAVRLEELEREYGFRFGDVEEETVGGYVFGRLAREVNAGDQVDVDGAMLRVEAVEGLRVTRVRVIPVSVPAPEPA